MARTYHSRLVSTSTLLALMATTLLSGCTTVAFYASAAAGQLDVLASRRSVESVIADPETDALTRSRLETAREILAFAEAGLGLDVGGRYRSYVALERSHLVWNLFVAPEFDTRGMRWCYPVVGCAVYRGYFEEAKALSAERRYRNRGFDTYVGGVAAYSTLGWFDDPLASTFIGWREEDLAELLFHELAHSVVFVRGDTAFNEAFASFVGRRGVVDWLRSRGRDPGPYVDRERTRDAFFDFLAGWRDRLGRLYAVETDAYALRLIKAEALRRMRAEYGERVAELGEGRYDEFMQAPFNNARLLTIGTYHERVGAFAALHAQSGGVWRAFFAAVEALARLDPAARDAALDALGEKEVAHR